MSPSSRSKSPFNVAPQEGKLFSHASSEDGDVLGTGSNKAVDFKNLQNNNIQKGKPISPLDNSTEDKKSIKSNTRSIRTKDSKTTVLVDSNIGMLDLKPEDRPLPEGADRQEAKEEIAPSTKNNSIVSEKKSNRRSDETKSQLSTEFGKKRDGSLKLMEPVAEVEIVPEAPVPPSI